MGGAAGQANEAVEGSSAAKRSLGPARRPAVRAASLEETVAVFPLATHGVTGCVTGSQGA